ncbi:NAD(P)H-binding protein [Nocardiopsis sediminis]|uniref:NAD(P)H-binding protein n=1 Tax=Nocardiopsis sediminis TaxID=1778267 RepID=A0ABV8FPV7_9ACTN
MTEKTTLVIGGTGMTGRRVTAGLREKGVRACVASRSGETRFDWTDPGTWPAALEGVDAAYIVPLDAEPSATPALVETAVQRGVTRLVLLSARGADVPGHFPDDFAAARTHLEGEEAVRASGAEWTILRPSWFAQNFSEGFFRDGVLAGELALPAGDGASAFIDADDIAAVGVAALTAPGHDGEVYELSGPRALTIAEALAEIAEAGGPRARYTPIDEAAFRAGLAAQGASEDEVDLWSGGLRPIRTGADAPIADGVERALGRPPRDFTEFARAAVQAGAWRP